jgi:Phage integrase, N-terminal SAM-like domain
MPETTAPADEPDRSKRRRRNAPKLRQGVMKRGNTWSYVIRVKDPGIGVSRPRWVGGFATEEAAKAARNEARVKARQGQYIDTNSITVATYLDQWIEAHAVQVKPKTLQDYRHLIDRHVRPRIGDLRLQAVRPATITKLYRDLATTGGRKATGLSPRTVEYIHAVLRKAFRDAIVVDQLLPSNPVERAKRHARLSTSQGRYGHQASSGHSYTPPASTAYSPSTALPHTPAPVVVSCSTSVGGTSTWISERSVLQDRPPSSPDSASREPPRAAGPEPSASMPRPFRYSGIIASDRPRSG